MKRYIIIGLMALSTDIVVASTVNVVTEDKSTKTLIIDLDKEIEDDGLKGGEFEILRGIIPMGNNDEVTFLGKDILASTPITIIIKDKYNKLKKTLKKNVLTIKSSDLDNGDTVVIKNRIEIVAEKKVKK